jgi:hypothetical protein
VIRRVLLSPRTRSPRDCAGPGRWGGPWRSRYVWPISPPSRVPAPAPHRPTSAGRLFERRGRFSPRCARAATGHDRLIRGRRAGRGLLAAADAPRQPVPASATGAGGSGRPRMPPYQVRSRAIRPRVSLANPHENASWIRFQTRCPPRRLAVCSRSAAGGRPTLRSAWRTGEGCRAASEHEQRLFEQIERSLAEDPKFASAVRASDPRFHARRRRVAGWRSGPGRSRRYWSTASRRRSPCWAWRASW